MTKFSVRKPFTIFVAVVAVAIFGVMSYTRMVPDLLPNMDFPYVIIVTTSPGSAPEEVESTITKPLEQAMATLNNIKTLSSASSENYSMLSLEFEEETNMDSIMVDILQKVQTLSDKWDDTVGTPTIMRINPSMLPVMVAAVDSAELDRYELCRFAQETLIPELEGTTGLASIATGGLVERTLTVSLSDERMDATNQKVEEALLKSLEETRQKLKDAQEEIDKGKQQVDYGTWALQNAPQNMVNSLGSNEELNRVTEDMANNAQEIAQTEQEQIELQQELHSKEDAKPALEEELEATQEALAEAEHTQAIYNKVLEGANAIDGGDGSANDMSVDDPTLGLSAEESAALMENGVTTVGDVRANAPALNAAVDAARGNVIAAQARLDANNLDITNLNTQIAANNVKLTTLRSEAVGYATQVAQLQSNVPQMTQQIMSGVGQMMMASGQLATAKAALESAQTTLDEANEAYQSQVELALKAADMRNIFTLETLSALIGAQNFNMPAGYVYEDGVGIIVSVGDGIGSIKELEELPLMDLGIEGLDAIRVGDVADVIAADNEAEIYATLNGNDSLILTFSKQSNYATARVSKNLLAKFAELSGKYPDITFTPLVDQGDYIYLIRDSIVSSILWGALFSVIILFIFLRDWRPTVITLFSIPVSLLFALTLMYFTNISLNVMSLSGLAISVGMLVDNSIVVIENTYRLRNLGESDIKAAVSGATQMGGAIAASTLTTICVFVPIAFVSGLIRQIFTDMILTLAYTLTASLIIALTLVPALTGQLLREEKEQKKGGWLERMMPRYREAVLWGVGHKAVVLLLAVALLLGSFAAILSRGFTFMPEMEMNQMNVDVTVPEGTSFEDTVRMANEVSQRILAVDGVGSVGGRAGAGGTSILSSGEADVTFYVLLEEGTHRKASAVAADINRSCEDMECTVFADSNSLMGMFMSMMTGSGITVRLYSNDLNELQAAADAVAQRLRGVEGITTVSSGETDPAEELHFTVDKAEAAKNGLTVAQVYMEVAKSLAGSAEIMTLTDDSASYAVTVETAGQDKLTREFLENFTFTVQDKLGEEKEIALGDIASVESHTTPSTINRLEQRRYIDVTAAVDENYNVTKVTDAAEAAMEGLELPESVKMSFSGEREAIMDAMKDMLLLLLLGIVLVYLVMVAQFQNLKSPFIVMFTIPLAFTGGFLGLLLFGMELNVLAMLGLIMLVGIIVNNGIVLVDYINQLRIGGMERREAIAEAAVTRLRPILMTSITTILGLVVMAMGQNEATSLVQPLAVTCIGGLVYATLMTLFVVPVMYDMLSKKELYAVSEEDLVLSTR